MQSLGKIAECAPAVGAKCDVCFFTGRMPRSGKLPVLDLLTGQKSGFFALQGRLVAPIQVKLCKTDGHLGPVGRAKFHINRRRGGGMRPQNITKFHFFGKESPVGAIPLTDFENV